MNHIERATIVQAVDDAGLDPQTMIYEGYSGRFMYGATCFGLVGTQNELMKVFIHIKQEIAEELSEAMRSDNMAKEMIFYFPGYELAPPQ